jgi:hypothetical protein
MATEFEAGAHACSLSLTCFYRATLSTTNLLHVTSCCSCWESASGRGCYRFTHGFCTQQATVKGRRLQTDTTTQLSSTSTLLWKPEQSAPCKNMYSCSIAHGRATQSANSHAIGTICLCTICALVGGHSTQTTLPCWSGLIYNHRSYFRFCHIHLEQTEWHCSPLRVRVLGGAAVVAPYPCVACRDVDTESRTAKRENAFDQKLVRFARRLQNINTALLKIVLGDDRIPA